MPLTASKLRENIYRILDEVLDTGLPVEIVRRGKKLQIVPLEDPRAGKLENLPKRYDSIKGNPEDLVQVDWSRTWRRGST